MVDAIAVSFAIESQMVSKNKGADRLVRAVHDSLERTAASRHLPRAPLRGLQTNLWIRRLERGWTAETGFGSTKTYLATLAPPNMPVALYWWLVPANYP